ARLAVSPGDPERFAYLRWRSVFAETCEARLVDIAVSRNGLIPAEAADLHTGLLGRRIERIASQLPLQGWLCGDRFTMADVVAGYNLRLAVQTGLLERSAVEPYLGRLMARPAARESRIFASLPDAE
ncbi:MAG: hypothetical protein KC656_07175, partial [Myxococcales bacterium]|nr:hypothetical protein [Myxococcales bacterium]